MMSLHPSRPDHHGYHRSSLYGDSRCCFRYRGRLYGDCTGSCRLHSKSAALVLSEKVVCFQGRRGMSRDLLQVMDPVEQLLATNEDNLSIVDLEKVVHLMTGEVQRHREQLTKQKTELQDLRTEENERSQRRERYASLFVQILDLQESLEEEEKTQQLLQEVTREMERLRDTSESSEVLESRLKELENIIAAYQEKEKKLQEEAEYLKRLLEKSKEELGETESEHQRVAEELHAVQTSLPDHGCPGRSEMEMLLDSCIREVGQLNVLPEKKRHKK